MKRKLALLLAGTLLCTALAGCKGNGSENEDAAETSTDGEFYNVIMQWPSMGEAPTGLADVEAGINAIVEPEIGVTVTLEPVDAYNLANETALTVSSNEQLDLCLSLFTGVGDLINSGTIMPLDQLYEQYGADITEACAQRIAGGYYGENLYAIPTGYISGEKYGYVCRTDLLDKYGITINEDKVYSMAELSDIFKTVKEGEGDGFYCIAGGQSTTDLFSILYPYDVLGTTLASGVLMLGDDFTSTEIVNLVKTDEYKEFAETTYDWAQKGYFTPDASTTTEEAPIQVMAGNHLGWFAGSCSAGPADYSSQTGQDMTIITTIEGCSMTNQMQSILWSIPTTCKNPEKTMQFLNYIYKDSAISTLLQYGIEGVSYEIAESDENGTVIKLPDGETTTTVPYWQPFGVYGNRFDWPVMAPNTTTTNKELKEFSDSITRFSPALGYCFVVDNVASEYSAVNSVVTQYMGVVNSGAVDPAVELPEYINALEAAGIDKIMAENQTQLDAWFANNQE